LSDVLATTFPEPVLESQAVFRAVMEAFARPGQVRPLPSVSDAPPPLSGTAAAIGRALLDYETPAWLDATLAAVPEIAAWIRFNAGARVTADPRQATFAFIADPLGAPAFDQFSLGTAEYPDRSTTLVLQVRSFGCGERLSLSGPGTAGRGSLSAEPLPADLCERLAGNRAIFPRGVDVILVSPNSVAALPRSALAERG
jgi:alpha-D-ribose 1-methylphosphonate 5-triphosphate synthase subunit PhnH